MRAMIALHPALGLRRTGRDDADAEFGTHASKLRQWRLPACFLGFAGWANIDVLPFRIQSLGNTVLLNPLPQQVGGCPGSLLASAIGTKWFRWHHPLDSSDSLVALQLGPLLVHSTPFSPIQPPRGGFSLEDISIEAKRGHFYRGSTILQSSMSLARDMSCAVKGDGPQPLAV